MATINFKMAAACMGAFGTYKTQQYLRYIQEREARKKGAKAPATDVVWVTKRFNPQDIRNSLPVPCQRLVASKVPPQVEAHWIPVTEPPLRSFERPEPNYVLPSYPSTRDEHWSTLRQMLPSRGCTLKVDPPKWGTGQARPPDLIDRQTRQPIVSSAMTRYMDEAFAATHFIKQH